MRDLVIALRGGYEASKCPFPRHAVVFFNDQGEPVGVVNADLICGDVFVEPDYAKPMEQKYADGLQKQAQDLVVYFSDIFEHKLKQPTFRSREEFLRFWATQQPSREKP